MKKLTVSGADISLFHLAARELGDATQWIRIAQANGLTDPMLSSVVTLTIPDVNPLLSGGLAQE